MLIRLAIGTITTKLVSFCRGYIELQTGTKHSSRDTSSDYVRSKDILPQRLLSLCEYFPDNSAAESSQIGYHCIACLSGYRLIESMGYFEVLFHRYSVFFQGELILCFLGQA